MMEIALLSIIWSQDSYLNIAVKSFLWVLAVSNLLIFGYKLGFIIKV